MNFKQFASKISFAHPLIDGSTCEQSKTSLWQLLRIWLLIGLQSFGGGTATLYLMRHAAVDQYQWLSAEEFTRDWSLCLAAPGINLLCMTILVGRRVAGGLGALIAMLGLLLPSVTLTILMTALYADLRKLPVIQAALQGVVPATVGIGILLTVNMTRPLLAASRRESNLSLLVSLLLLVGSAVAVLIWQAPVLLVLCSAGAIGGIMMWYETASPQRGNITKESKEAKERKDG